MLETATHVDIDVQPLADHGVLQQAPVANWSHPAPGALGDCSAALTAFCASVEATSDPWPACAATAPCALAAVSWPPCMRQRVPLASIESWSSSALESSAVMRWTKERRRIGFGTTRWQ